MAMSHAERLYKYYASKRLGDYAKGKITVKWFEKDLERYRKAYGIKKKKYWI